MSTNRCKTKRLSLRKKTNNKSSKSPRRRPQGSLGLPSPQPLQLNSETSLPSKPLNKLQPRSQVIRSKSSSSSSSSPTPHQTYGANSAIANILEANPFSISHQQTMTMSIPSTNPSAKLPHNNKMNMNMNMNINMNMNNINKVLSISSTSGKSLKSQPSTTPISHSIDNLNDLGMLEEDEDLNTIQPLDNIGVFNQSPSLFADGTDNISHSSISDILGGIHNLAEEDSDDLEEQTKAMFAKLDHLDLGNHASTASLNRQRVNTSKDGTNKPLRKIMSTPAVSTMDKLSHRRGSSLGTTITRKNIHMNIDKNKIKITGPSQQLFKSASQSQSEQTQTQQTQHQNINHNDDFNIKVPKNRVINDTEETSPSSVSTNNTDKESIHSTQSQRTVTGTEYVTTYNLLHFRSLSIHKLKIDLK